jgi:hypothetical protein
MKMRMRMGMEIEMVVVVVMEMEMIMAMVMEMVMVMVVMHCVIEHHNTQYAPVDAINRDNERSQPKRRHVCANPALEGNYGFCEAHRTQEGLELPPPKKHAQREHLQLDQSLELKRAFFLSSLQTKGIQVQR